MRKSIIVLTVLLIALTVGSTIAGAQTQFSLGVSSATDRAIFTSNGSGATIAACDNVACNNNTWVGAVTGEVSNIPITSGSWTMNWTGAGAVLASDFSITQAAPISFSMSVIVGGVPETLTGNLELVDLGIASSKSKTGTFNDVLDANLQVTGGTLESQIGSNGIVDVTINFSPSGAFSASFFASPGQKVNSTFSSGEVLTTAEPTSLLLLGTGLLGIGAAVRRRLLS